MIDNLANQQSERPDYTSDRHALRRHEAKSRSPAEIENDKPGKHSKRTGSNSARLSRKSSKASGKEGKVQRSSPESEDRSFHQREQIDHDAYHSHKSSSLKHEFGFDSLESTDTKLDQDVFDSLKITGHKPIHASRKSLIDNHSFREGSAKNIHHVAFTPETSEMQPPTAPVDVNLRELKLDSKSKEEFSPHGLRSVFRLLDEDGSKELSPAEVKKGLIQLGFQAAEDPVALTRLLGDIDEDKTGKVTESEFLGYFADLTRETLAKNLGRHQLNHTYIRAVQYGPDAFSTDAPLPAKRVLTALKDPRPPGRRTLWLDVVGYDPETAAALAEGLGLSPSGLCDALCPGETRAELLLPPAAAAVAGGCCCGERGAALAVHAMQLSVNPVKTRRRPCTERLPKVLQVPLELLFGGDPVQRPGNLQDKALVSGRKVKNMVVSLEQATLLLADEWTLVTFRSPCLPVDKYDSNYFKHHSDSKESPFANDKSQVRTMFDDLRKRIEQKSVDAAYLRRSDARSLAAALVDTIMWGNYERVMDTLQDWEELLEANIKAGYSASNTAHLNAIKVTAKNLEEILEQQFEQLLVLLQPKERAAITTHFRRKSAETNACAEEEKHDGGETESEGKKGLLASAGGLVSQVGSRKDDLMRWGEDGLEDSHADEEEEKRKLKDNQLLASFFLPVQRQISDIISDVGNAKFSMEVKKTKIEALSKLMSDEKTDFMNLTLYSLTLITALATPLMFLTGLFGMNFADMEELDPELSGMGYKNFFWPLFGSTFAFVILMMMRLRLFAALM